MINRFAGILVNRKTLAALTVSLLLAACGGGGGGGGAPSDGGSSASGGGSTPTPPAPTLSLFAGEIGMSGSTNGQGIFASFNGPSSVATDRAGNIYVADSLNNLIRKITPTGVTTTFAGSGAAADVDGVGTASSLNDPIALTIDKTGNLYVTEGSVSIRKIAPDGTVSTIANKSALSYADNEHAGPILSGIVVDGNSNLYVTDSANSVILHFTQSGSASIVAGSLNLPIHVDGTIATAGFSTPTGIAIDTSGNLYVSDSVDFTVRKISKDGTVTTIAGSPNVSGNIDGAGRAAEFGMLAGLTLDNAGNLYVADYGNATIRKISPLGAVTTLAGTSGYGGVDGNASTATFFQPMSIAFDGSGNLYVADTGDNVIRKISPQNVVSTIAGQTPQIVAEANYASNLCAPSGLTVDANGNVIVFDEARAVLYRITPTGSISALAGGDGDFSNKNGIGSAATFMYGSPPISSGVATDSKGNIYVADAGNYEIRMVTPAGAVTTFAGSHFPGYKDGPVASALFGYPYGIAIDAQDNVYVADAGNNNIRKITQDGTVSTLAGSGARADTDGAGLAASINDPLAMSIDKAGNLYVIEINGSVRKITQAGVVTTLPAIPRSITTPGATSVSLNSITVDDIGNVYVIDGDTTIRQISPTGVITTLAGVPTNNGISPFIPGAPSGSLGRPIGLAYHKGTLYFSTLQGIATINNLP